MPSNTSEYLMSHVRMTFYLCLSDLKSGKYIRQVRNGFSRHAVPAYIAAVAAVEAFVNETMLSQRAVKTFSSSSLWKLQADELVERLELDEKLIMIPQALFNKPFDADDQICQDMSLLVGIKNDLLRGRVGKPEQLKSLRQRKLILNETGDLKWPDTVSCSEGVRWANNSACDTIKKLVSLFPDGYKAESEALAAKMLRIEEAEVSRWFQKEGIDPNSDHVPGQGAK